MTPSDLPTPAAPAVSRLLTAERFQRLADVPPEVEWFATERRVRKNDHRHPPSPRPATGRGQRVACRFRPTRQRPRLGRRADENPVTVVGIDRPTIDRDLKAIGHKDFVVIDGAPQAADLAVSAIKAASFILIPVQPSPYDIWATADLVELVKQRIEVTDGKLQAAFVVSRAIKGTRIGAKSPRLWPAMACPFLNPASRSA
jgi:hypothetical protein